MGPKRQNNKRKGEAQQQQGEKRGKAGTGSGAAGVSEVILKKLSKEGLELEDLYGADEFVWNGLKQSCNLTLRRSGKTQEICFPSFSSDSSSSSSSFPPSAGEI